MLGLHVGRELDAHSLNNSVLHSIQIYELTATEFTIVKHPVETGTSVGRNCQFSLITLIVHTLAYPIKPIPASGCTYSQSVKVIVQLITPPHAAAISALKFQNSSSSQGEISRTLASKSVAYLSKVGGGGGGIKDGLKGI